jgi:hypothetical protein
LTVASKWQTPAPDEIQSIIQAVEKRSGIVLGCQEVASLLGLEPDGHVVVAEWVDGSASIPYACWAVLCEMAGLGLIWRVGDRPTLLDFT